jgi:hypothetical protein
VPVYYTSSATKVATVQSTAGAVQSPINVNDIGGLVPGVRIAAKDTGHVMVAARTYAYGRILRDSVEFSIALRQSWNVAFFRSPDSTLTVQKFSPRIVLGIGAVITFLDLGAFGGAPAYANKFGPMTVHFAGPAPMDTATDGFLGLPPTGVGDITFRCDSVSNPDCFSPNEVAKARRFAVPGTYYVSIEKDTLTVQIDAQ